MTSDNISTILNLASQGYFQILDLTGGAPELHPEFCDLIESVRAWGIHVIDRCNLSVLEEPGQERLAGFLAENRVEVIASLPCYMEQNVDAQRGDGVFDKSIQALKRLNSEGYGIDADKILNLVFNPQGPTLPPSQASLEDDYREKLKNSYNISFNKLYAIANMPIKRFGSTLVSKGQFHEYMQLLRSSFSQDNLDSVMCRQLISVDWQGFLYDCDFNQMLELNMCDDETPLHLSMLPDINFAEREVAVMGHCYGCTAGQGSSCGGAL